MIDHDRLFKELLTTFFIEFIELFLPAIAERLDRDSIRFLDKEIFSDVTSGEKREADLVAQVRWLEPESSRPEEAFFLIHVENQASAQRGFSKRMFRYFARLHEKFDLPVYPVVIFSFDQPRRAEADHYEVRFPDLDVLTFRFRTIQLNRLPWRDYVKHKNPVASALMSKMQIAPEERPHVKLECLRLLTTLKLDAARMQLISGFVDTYLKLDASEERIFQAEMEEEIAPQKEEMMQIVTSWMQEGIEMGLQQGLEQGLEQGRREATLGLSLRLLQRRLGALPASVQNRIRALALPEAEALSEALLDFESFANLEAWLDEHELIKSRP